MPSDWHLGHNDPPPSGLATFCLKARDLPRVTSAAAALLWTTPDETAHARLLASQRKETGEWLQALPMSAQGLCTEDEVIRVAAGLCLSPTLCFPHRCRQCGTDVDNLALHGLSCRNSLGCHPRHAVVIPGISHARFLVIWSPQASCAQTERGLTEPQ